MAARIQKKEIVSRIAKRMVTDETTAEAFLDATIEVLYEAIKAGESVTLPSLGGFYVRPEPDSWVFKFNPGQKLRALFGWSSSYTGEL
ncbi:MAG: HU family DNA-binding protein [Anaerolineae bacterium]|nr:HU family DNA-binding protein [Anaerolineae bacterium]